MVYLWTGICFFILVSLIAYYKDLSAPPVLSAAIWLMVYVLLIASKTKYIHSKYIGCFAIALIFFVLGFFVFSHVKMSRNVTPESGVRISNFYSKIMLMFMYISALAYIYIYRKDIVGHSSIWASLRNSEIEANYYLGVLVNAFPIIAAFALYACCKTPNKGNRRFFYLTLPPTMFILLTSNRTTWFSVITLFLFVIVYTKKMENKAIIKLAIIATVAVAVLFVISTLSKYSNVMASSSSAEKIYYYLNVYFKSPPVAFLQWLEKNPNFEYGFGKYTFRFFVALFKVFSPSITVPNTVMNFTIVDGMRTNVYTILHWYTMDGGLMWAYIVQFIIGMIYGILYKKVRYSESPSRFYLVFLAMFMCVIMGQFFCDQFATHISIWIQRIIWCYFCAHYLVQETSAKQVDMSEDVVSRIKWRILIK